MMKKLLKLVSPNEYLEYKFDDDKGCILSLFRLLMVKNRFIQKVRTF